MKVNRYIVSTLITAAGYVHATDGYVFSTNDFPFETIFVTPTNLMIKFNYGHFFIRYPDDSIPEFSLRKTSELMENNEALILPPNQRLEIYTLREVHIQFVPVAFKGQRKGFRVTKSFASHPGYETPANTVLHIALGDTLVEVGEEDVEAEIPLPPRVDPAIQDLIARHGEKKAMEIVAFAEAFARTNQQGRATSPPVEEEGGAAASPPSRLWLYVGIALCLFPILYFLRRNFSKH